MLTSHENLWELSLLFLIAFLYKRKQIYLNLCFLKKLLKNLALGLWFLPPWLKCFSVNVISEINHRKIHAGLFTFLLILKMDLKLWCCSSPFLSSNKLQLVWLKFLVMYSLSSFERVYTILKKNWRQIRVLARPYLVMLYVIFPIYVNFPITSRCVSKATVHTKNNELFYVSWKSFFFFLKKLLWYCTCILYLINYSVSSLSARIFYVTLCIIYQLFLLYHVLYTRLFWTYYFFLLNEKMVYF